MKASDFKIPFPFEERRPALLDRFFFVPGYFPRHEEFADRFCEGRIFEEQKPLAIEYCSGNGEWIAHKAKTNPDMNWLAVEKRFDRARKIWLKLKNQGINNLFVVLGEALTFSSHYLKDGLLSEIYINFPDPWPKSKHAKHRLVTENFASEMARITKREGSLIIATDDLDSLLRMQQSVALSEKWSPFFDSPGYVESWPEYGASYFDSLWRKKGLTIRYLKFVKR